MQEVDFQEWPHCPDISETKKPKMASYSGTFLKCMLLTWLSSGLSNQHLKLWISYLFLSFFCWIFLSFPLGPYPFFLITEGFAFMVACSLWLFPAGWLQNSLPGEKRKHQDKSTLAILSLWNPHDSHWLEYNLTRLSDYSARRLLISFSYSVWYWYWRKWKGKESSLKSCVVTSVLEHGKCLTSYGYCYFISLVGMPQS